MGGSARHARAIRWLRISYWAGAVFDGLTIVPMLVPSVGAVAFGLEDFRPGPEYRYAMGVAAALMAGWTCLLLWADRRPLERRGVLLLTVVPVIVGLAAAGGYAVAAGVVAASAMAPTWGMQGLLAMLFTYSYWQARAL